jgi:hypothetical protein
MLQRRMLVQERITQCRNTCFPAGAIWRLSLPNLSGSAVGGLRSFNAYGSVANGRRVGIGELESALLWRNAGDEAMNL